MMNLIDDNIPAEEALDEATATYGRFDEAVQIINPRKQ